MRDNIRIKGKVTIQVFDKHGKIKHRTPGFLRRLFGLDGRFLVQEFHNIVTREGDALIADALLASPTKTKVTSATGFIQVGTGWTSNGAKTNTRCNTPTGSMKTLDANYPARKAVWGLSRWGGNSGLRFVPPDDEGFTLRGDTRRLVYKRRRRSHRFTILADGAFEYDVILEREPESNVIVLPMEGAERFDFFRQPDFIKDPLLAGSYAVCKKETLIGEGTGKLCHIHRPEIIDARGRRCWGDLSVAGNCLCITIPEHWLAEAEYPIVVDPTIGTTTVGSQTYWDNVDNESYDQLFIEVSLTVNRFLVPETLNNTATAYVYTYERDYDDDCKPVLYSDYYNVPFMRRSMSEGIFDIAVNNTKPAGWRSTTFSLNTSITGGSYIWFGLFCNWFAPRFDYGAK